MKKVRYIYWRDTGMWLGFLQEFPDYMTQGRTWQDLREHLRDLYNEMAGDSRAVEINDR